MSNIKEFRINSFPETEVLKDIFRTPEIQKRAAEFDGTVSSSGEGFSLIYKKARGILDILGHKEKGVFIFNDYFQTEPVRLPIGNRQVDLSLDARGDKSEIAVLAKIVGMDGSNIPILFSAFIKGHRIKAESGNAKILTRDEVSLALGLLSFMAEPFPNRVKSVQSK